MSREYVLCAFQLQPMAEARQSGQQAVHVSLDLGLTQSEVRLDESRVYLPDGQSLEWAQLREVLDAPQNCFLVSGNDLEKIQVFSEYTNRHYVLMATESAPTMLVSGLPMHRIKDTNPHADTLTKLQAIQPVVGQVLDTTTGLGYTAIEAARAAQRVFTIELDPAVMEIIRRNPWSRPLQGNPRIRQLIGDSYDLIEIFPDGMFDRILHDPPTISLAGDLYSTDFYRQLYRVLARRGILFHYIGDLDSKLGGRVARGAAERLREAGFRQVRPRPQAFGLVARK